MEKYFHECGGTLRPIDRLVALLLGLVLLLALTFLFSGCGEPMTIYQVEGTCVATTQKVLIMPFMDTRTFVDGNDPHKESMGEHARDIYVAAMRDNPVLRDVDILAPELPRQEKSLTSAEVAEIGRKYDADVVVAGQVFSFNGTRAASIPPRAGMFVRVVSVSDGTVLFVGDHYQAAGVPGAPGGRDYQARQVADRLIEGMVRQGKPLAAKPGVQSTSAYAMIAPRRAGRTVANKGGADHSRNRDGETVRDAEPIPQAPPFLELNNPANTDFDNPATWEQSIPEAPPLINYNDDFYNLPVAAPEPEPMPLPPPEHLLEEAAEAGYGEPPYSEEVQEAKVEVEEVAIAEETAPEPIMRDESDRKAETPVAEPAHEEQVAVTEPQTVQQAPAEVATETNAPAPVAEPMFVSAAALSGDELAADLFASEGEVPLATAGPAAVSVMTMISPEPLPETITPVPTQAEVFAQAEYGEGRILESYESYITTDPEPAFVEPAVQPEETLLPATGSETGNFHYITEYELAYASFDSADIAVDGPIYSTPLAVEQPRTFRSVDLVEIGEDPEALRQDSEARVSSPFRGRADDGAIRVLVLPYHDRENENNLIPATGGGEVVTTLYGAQLAQEHGVRVLWDATGQTTHDRLVDKAEAVQLGRMVNADYVIRGQVVEFRRAQSVPSFYSAVISTGLLAAQIFFAEFSGVDVATEVYRISDGMCVMSRRDRAQQKYVVQSEKTVRKLATGMAKSVLAVMKSPNSQEMDPLIDSVEPVTIFTNPR